MYDCRLDNKYNSHLTDNMKSYIYLFVNSYHQIMYRISPLIVIMLLPSRGNETSGGGFGS